METFKPGDKVVFTSEELHQEYPSFFPPAGTEGTVLGATFRGEYDVQWPTGSTSKDDQWLANHRDLQAKKEGTSEMCKISPVPGGQGTPSDRLHCNTKRRL